MGQQVRHLRVQADVIKRIRKLLLDPADNNNNRVRGLARTGPKDQEQGSRTYVRSPVSWPLVPTEELRLMMRRSTSFLSNTLEAGPSSEMAFTPTPQE